MKNLLMFLDENFQHFCEINQRLLNATRHIYFLFELQFEKSDENNKFSFKFNVVNDNENTDVC